MSPDRAAQLIALDKRHLWHPFTPMREWCAPGEAPLILVSGQGAILRDSGGREYIDGNSSIWTNIHGHNHPRINEALRAQLGQVAHTSFLGFTNAPAVVLGERVGQNRRARSPYPRLLLGRRVHRYRSSHQNGAPIFPTHRPAGTRPFRGFSERLPRRYPRAPQASGVSASSTGVFPGIISRPRTWRRSRSWSAAAAGKRRRGRDRAPHPGRRRHAAVAWRSSLRGPPLVR